MSSRGLIIGIIIIAVIGVACSSSSNKLKEGRWTGTLTPQNHPDMKNPVGYEVQYVDKDLRIFIIGPENTMQTRNPRLEKDTLYFSFVEPEERITLDCALARQNDTGFAGRCTDARGKWARFTMRPPE